MLNYSFIFSEKRSDWIKRHLLFWGFWWFYFGMLHAANHLVLHRSYIFKICPYTITESVLLMLPQMDWSIQCFISFYQSIILQDKYTQGYFDGPFLLWFIGGGGECIYGTICQSKS